MKFKVNKPLVPMKAHYFLLNAGTGPVVPYLSIYARQLGFSSVVVGLIYTILPVFGMIVKPTVGAISDRFHCQKTIFLIAQLLTAVAFLSIFYAPKVPIQSLASYSCLGTESMFSNVAGVTIDSKLVEKIQNQKATTSCELVCQMSSNDLNIICSEWNLTQYCGNSLSSQLQSVNFTAMVPLAETNLFKNTTFIDGQNVTNQRAEFMATSINDNGRIFTPSCSLPIRTTCNIACDKKDIESLLLRTEIPDSEAYSTYQFWVFLLLMIVAWCGQAAAVSLGDAICFELLGDKPNRYGYQRMYGALGWGLLSLLTGVLVDVLSKNKAQPDYTICFYMAAAFLVVDFIVSSRIQYSQSKLSTSILKDVGKLLLNIRIIVFLLWCICVGMCTGLVWQFLLWLVQDLATAQGQTRIKTLQGIIMGVQCLGGELPFFFLSGKILKKIGHISAMSLVLFAIGVRFVLYSVIDNPWYFIPIEFSNGLTFGLFYACMASYASIVAPAGTEATMQGMVGAVFEGVGVSLGSLLAGLAQSKVSGSLTFRYFGFGALAASVLHLIVQYFLKAQDSPVVDRRKSFEKVKWDNRQEQTSEDPLIKR
ncbi:unnamed protein product [Ceutorhynchus assimilis]|uniref:Major facilitator superfamily associated domain-containing protein n=1 Tax=Ceutorhynchus assimilis TaxID=467358 RepID=A0A9N9MTV1_9CUCU|nr:unnamed protein product [Ceutorhynchus assimilis]